MQVFIGSPPLVMILSGISIRMSLSWRSWLHGISRTSYRLVLPPLYTACWHTVCSVQSQFSQGYYGTPTMIKSCSFSLCSATGMDLLNCICTQMKLSEFLKKWPQTLLTVSTVLSLIPAPAFWLMNYVMRPMCAKNIRSVKNWGQ